MKTIKKHIKLYKLNQQIHHLHREIVPVYAFGSYNHRIREDERTIILRKTMNQLIEERKALKNS